MGEVEVGFCWVELGFWTEMGWEISVPLCRQRAAPPESGSMATAVQVASPVSFGSWTAVALLPLSCDASLLAGWRMDFF